MGVFRPRRDDTTYENDSSFVVVLGFSSRTRTRTTTLVEDFHAAPHQASLDPWIGNRSRRSEPRPERHSRAGKT